MTIKKILKGATATAVALSLSLSVMLSAPPPAGATQPYSPNQYAGQPGYAALLQSCRWYADWIVAGQEYNAGQPGVWNANQDRYNTNQFNQANTAYVLEGSPGYGVDTPDYGSYWIWSEIVYYYFHGYSSNWTVQQLVDSMTGMDNVCALVFPQQGSASDYVLGESRWSACNGPITWSTTGPDPTWQLAQLAAITGLDIEQVSSGGDLQYSWTSGTGGSTTYWATGNYFSSGPQGQPPVTILIGQNSSSAGIQAALYHESGHGIGINHAVGSSPPGTDEMMHWIDSAQNPLWINYGNGDIAGAEAVGIAAGC